MENGCNIASKKDVIICKRIDDSNSVGVETITPKKMLKIYYHYSYDIQMLKDFNLECNDGMTSEKKILLAEVKKIEKLVIIGGIHGANRVLVGCNK